MELDMSTTNEATLLDRRETRSPRLRSLLPADEQDVAHWLQRIERGQTPGLRTRAQAVATTHPRSKLTPDHYRAAVISGLRDWRTS
jgi:type II secretory pathway component HofQ